MGISCPPEQYIYEEIVMKKIDFNQNWQFRKGDAGPQTIALPHDAMLYEPRNPGCLNGKNTGYFPGGVYYYTKTFMVPADWQGKSVSVEFEGVYHNCMVSLNGNEAGRWPYGYTGFILELSDMLRYGTENVITVTADTSKEPNTRWYSGSGIYRPVWLYVGSRDHIEPNGIEISTISANPPEIRVRTRSSKGVVQISVQKAGRTLASAAGDDVRIIIPDAMLWDEEHPNLYTCTARLMNMDGGLLDEQTTRFGICERRWSTRGLYINGKETKLRGACIHHDNRPLGACEFPAAARRRVKILKDAGFNAIRSAHNPISRAMLDACDEIGMYVMDELADMWYEHKNRYDYASCFEKWHTRDLTAMVLKDISHPSVVMYSIGNEVTETAEPSGIDYARSMAKLCHELDAARPVTCGINMALNVMHFAGMGVYKPVADETVRPPEPKNPKAAAILGKMMEARRDQAAKSAAAREQSDTGAAGTAALGMPSENGEKQNGKLVGSEMFNRMMVMMKEQQQAVVKQEIARILSEDAYAALDIAGYNYAITRYELDAREYPDRVSVGAETLPQRIYQNWQHVTACSYSVGDFIWTGWDYIGEAGIGMFCYDSVGEKDGGYPDLLAGCGVIDILGHPRPEVWLNKVVYGLERGPYIGVEPLTHAGENHIISAWRFSDAVHSWSWAGCEGRTAEIVVYSGGAEVELIQDGTSLGRQSLVECQAGFSTIYRPGILTAVAYDAEGNELGRDVLQSAQGDIHLTLTPDKTEMTADGQDLCYLDIDLRGENNVLETGMDREITLTVEGTAVLAGFGSAAPCTTESYVDNRHRTYYGRAQAVLRAGTESGKAVITVCAPGCEPVLAELVTCPGTCGLNWRDDI